MLKWSKTVPSNLSEASKILQQRKLSFEHSHEMIWLDENPKWSNIVEFGENYSINALDLVLHHIVVGANHQRIHTLLVFISLSARHLLSCNIIKVWLCKKDFYVTQFIQSFGNNNFLIVFVIIKFVIRRIYITYRIVTTVLSAVLGSTLTVLTKVLSTENARISI